jgi:hypothetical protein
MCVCVCVYVCVCVCVCLCWRATKHQMLKRKKNGEKSSHSMSLLSVANGDSVPYIVAACVQAIESRGLADEGLYRLSG